MTSKLSEYIKSDLARLIQPTFLNFLLYYFFPKGSTFRFTVWLRIMQNVKAGRIRKIFSVPVYLLFRHYEYKYGIHVNANISIGKGLKIVHGDGVYLNCKSIGENVTIFQGVTLGANKGSKNIPTVKDNVTLYVGAVVVGDIVLHNNCTVGANAFVNKSVSADDTVVGIPAVSIVGKCKSGG